MIKPSQRIALRTLNKRLSAQISEMSRASFGSLQAAQVVSPASPPVAETVLTASGFSPPPTTDTAIITKPMIEERQANVVIAYHTAIDAMTGGYAESTHFDTIVYALNVGLILAERGLGGEYVDLLRPAIEAMSRAKERYLSGKRLGLDGDGLNAVRAAADLHAEQMRLATHAELALAVDEMHRRVTAGNVYKAAA